MKILYIGYAIECEQCKMQNGVSVAGNNMQLGLLEVLHSKMGDQIEIITILPTPPYPQGKSLWVKMKKIYITEKIQATQISFLNLPLIKQIWHIFSVYLTACRYLDVNPECRILSYNAFPSVGIPVCLLKKKYQLQTICLLADLPIDIQKRNFFLTLLRAIMDKLTVHAIKTYDKVIVLNKRAAEEYIINSSFIVVDGAIKYVQKHEKDPAPTFTLSAKKIIMFSGTLVEYNGIKMLVEAMDYIHEPDVVLHIYGDGPLLEYIQNRCKERNNIMYCGAVSSREIKQIQKTAYILINPRPTRDPISLVTFPSKILEYMMSGTPVASTRLNGLTKDYFAYINIIDDSSPISMSVDIKKCLDMPYAELKKKAYEARQFIINNKTWRQQGEIIFDFLME